MFSASVAATTEAMRPGLISGLYPQRSDPKFEWMDRSLIALQGILAQLKVDRGTDLQEVAADIGRQGRTLTDLSDAQLNNLRIALRRHFRTRGLKRRFCAQAFALIREMSYRTIGLRHYDSQLMGGWVMLQGQLAEMETGEGKTLAATLPAATAALAGIPVHVITVNEYLVERDATAMGSLYRALGLTVGYVTQTMSTQERRAAYACDITYGTNKQIAFDYLRDRLILGNERNQLRLRLESVYNHTSRLERFMLRGLCFAVVDEADSVMIDEARTPLILTRNIDGSLEHDVYHQALKLAQTMERERDFFINPAQRRVQLSLAGQEQLQRSARTMDDIWQNPRRSEELLRQALQALHLIKRDRDYLVQENKIVIIDTNTGRTMPDRSWERGLHQMVEVKEGCPLTQAREQLARLTYQRFFRRYLRIGAMTGTAREVGSELWSVYGLQVRRIPLHRSSRRREFPARIFATAEGKWRAVVASVREMQALGRPVLVGTGSVADSDLLSDRLTAEGIPHRVLNARQDKEEAEIVAAAGRMSQITVATNMAGRGTDIPLDEGVAERGGLHVIATCRNEAKRIDRQLSGRCARQGDPGSHQALLSLQDELVLQHCHRLPVRILRRITATSGLFQRYLNLYLIRCAQRRVEGRHREARRALLKYERRSDRLLAFSGYLE
jgi:preprotein translocase subunit SecA